uniref:Peptidase S74 domain-containing protein n=1 Tax=viral metagenome TaxID=1070528 RepID=A0A6C0D926_9ZZZZ
MSIANYGEKSLPLSAYQKMFHYGDTLLWNYKTSSASGISQLFLNPVNSNAIVNISTNLFVGGKTTDATIKLYVNGNVRVDGNITASGVITPNVIIPSDLYLKNNIETLSLSGGLKEDLMKIEPIQFNYKDDKNKKLHFGFIAQEVEQYFPNLVNTISTSMNEEEITVKSLNCLEFIPLLLLKIKDLQHQIDLLKNK